MAISAVSPAKGCSQRLEVIEQEKMHILRVIMGHYSLWMQSGVQILNFRAPRYATMGFTEQRPFPYSEPKTTNNTVKNLRVI